MCPGRKAGKGRTKIINQVLFQKYHVLSLLGSGGSSSVYLAEHLKLEQYRAVKCIPKAQVRISTQYLEASLLKSLRHPGIPMIYDMEEDENFLYIIEEYIQGESLSAFLQNHNNISQETIISFGIQLCGIIEYLHNQKPYPILYLDLKPEHIIICGNQLKLIDYGISSVFGGHNIPSQSHGTPGFAAPEQRNGSHLVLQTDVYGIGAVLYYMLTKELLPPYSGTVYLFPKYCSLHFKKIIKKAVSPEYKKRYQNANELRKALLKISLGRADIQQKAHLLKKISIIGSQEHIGVTHIAVSLVSWLNHLDQDAYYESVETTNFLSSLACYQDHVWEEHGVLRYHNFQAVTASSFWSETKKSHIFVQDYGTDVVSVQGEENRDLLILVLGSRTWEMEYGLRACQALSGEEDLILICNYNDKQTAGKYASILKRQVYYFPLDQDPFAWTKEKHRLFQEIWKGRRI